MTTKYFLPSGLAILALLPTSAKAADPLPEWTFACDAAGACKETSPPPDTGDKAKYRFHGGATLEFTTEEKTRIPIEDCLDPTGGCIQFVHSLGDATLKVNGTPLSELGSAPGGAPVFPPPARPLADEDAPSINWTVAAQDGPLVGRGAKLSLGASTGVEDLVEDLFTVMAEIAVDRAKRKGAQLLIDTAATQVCRITLPERRPGAADVLSSSGEPDPIEPCTKALPSTCELLEGVNVADLASVGAPLKQALLADTIHLATYAIDDESVQLIVDTAVRDLIAKRGRVSRADARRIVSLLVDVNWLELAAAAKDSPAKQKSLCIIAFAMTAVRACDQVAVSGTDSKCDTVSVVDEMLKTAIAESTLVTTCSPSIGTQGKLRIEALANLAAGAIAVKRRGADPKALVHDAVEFAFEVAETLAKDGVHQKLIASVSATVLAGLDENPQGLIQGLASAMTLLPDVLAEEFSVELGPKARAFLTAAIAYTESYALTDATAAHEARRAVLEAMMDEAADRSGRDGDAIWSIGINVGLAPLSFQAGEGITTQELSALSVAQVSLPLGFAMQKTWNKKPDGKVRVGLHAMAFVFDLGQYAAFSASGDEVNHPRWDTALTVGGQFGMLVGNQRNPFIIGLDGRYSPTLFAQEKGAKHDGGAARFGLFLGYYIPFFDFN